MAYDDSEALQPNSTYSLGGYTFELKVQTVHEPGEEDVVSVFAICRSPDGTRETVPMDFPVGTTVESWSVECNETEATVYATIKSKSDIVLLDGEPVHYLLTDRITHKEIYETASFGELQIGGTLTFEGTTITTIGNPPGYIRLVVNGRTRQSVFDASHFPGVLVRKVERYPNSDVYDFPRVILRYTDVVTMGRYDSFYTYRNSEISYADSETEVIIARFAINLRDADGGPDGDWDEPGDVGPDPEKHFTLTVSVTGASAGSNSGMPLEAGQAGGYGDGGTGGNGGGGGAGASTVIIYEFATSKADNVVQEATAQGPGTGGPGGKGGKGGDGCILIFY